MDIELSIQLVPTDMGIVLLARTNDRYKEMVRALNLEFDGEYSYVVPDDDPLESLITPEYVDLSIFGHRDLDEGKSLVYKYPYSERELARWIHVAEQKFMKMKEAYAEIQQRLTSELEELQEKESEEVVNVTEVLLT